jgi:hypothetical protein
MAAVLAKLDRKELADAEEIGLMRERGRTPVEVKWSDMLDAEFAETWSENVTHDQLEVMPNNRRPEIPKWVILEQEQEERLERIRLEEEEAERLAKIAAEMEVESKAAKEARKASLPPREGEEKHKITL